MNKPLVSIIIPNYNRANLIGETLDSILAQTYTHWECIIVDDGSTDNSKEVIQKYVDKDNRFQLYDRPDDIPKGANACRNYGFELSKGEYINWFDSDDIMHPEKLSKQISTLSKQNSNFSVCQSYVFENNIKNILGLRHNSIYSESPFEDFLKHKITWLTQAPLFKKSFLLNNNLRFDETLQAAQEFEFFCRVLYVSPSYQYTNEPLVFLRKHENSISYNKDEQNRQLHYFKAREIVFDFLYENNTNIKYLDEYISKAYFYYINNRLYKKGIRTLIKRILSNRFFNLRFKFNMIMALLPFSIFKRSSRLLTYNRYRSNN